MLHIYIYIYIYTLILCVYIYIYINELRAFGKCFECPRIRNVRSESLRLF